MCDKEEKDQESTELHPQYLSAVDNGISGLSSVVKNAIQFRELDFSRLEYEEGSVVDLFRLICEGNRSSDPTQCYIDNVTEFGSACCQEFANEANVKGLSFRAFCTRFVSEKGLSLIDYNLQVYCAALIYVKEEDFKEITDSIFALMDSIRLERLQKSRFQSDHIFELYSIRE